MKRSWAIFVVVLGLFPPGAAFGVTCEEPRVDKTVIDSVIMIIEGTAGSQRPLNSREKKAIREQGLKPRDGGIGDLSVYDFTVTRGWKGVKTGQSVDVLVSDTWGGSVFEGENYLVVSPRQFGPLFWSPLCGSTVSLEYAADNGFLASLERLTGKD